MTARWQELMAALRRETLLVEAPPEPVEVTSLTTDSRAVGSGTLFIAVRGTQTDGHRFVSDAVAKGAAALVVERPGSYPVPAVVVEDGRRAAIALARTWYGDPSRVLVVVGITGTSGKTTTTTLMQHLLNRTGQAGSIGTLGAFDGHGVQVQSTAGSLTTPGPVDLQATFAALRERGVAAVAMETSSHSLDQGRLDGVSFAGAIFTNLSRDHLDYHGTMEQYLAAKLKLVTYLAPDGVAAVNADERAWDAIPRKIRTIRYGLHADAEVRAVDLVTGPTESRFTIEGRFGRKPVTLPLPGEFNVANALGAAACALGLGLSLGETVERLETAPQVPGRMERIVDQPFVVIRDYAHKPDALERVLTTLRPLTAGRLIVLYGAGGDRDRGKRPMMGQIAGELADLSVVTSDNPRTEDPNRIIDDIVQGIPSGASVVRSPDRREAIRQTLELAQPGDTVVLAGKGHETYQVVGKTYLPFDEREIVLDLMARRS